MGVIDRPTTPYDRIIMVVARYYGLTEEQLKSKTRRHNISRPRQVAMYLIRLSGKHTLKGIGEMFGGLDHTTVTHATHAVQARIESEPDFLMELYDIKSKL